MPAATGVFREAHIGQKDEPGQQDASCSKSCEAISFHFYLRIKQKPRGPPMLPLVRLFAQPGP
jgi:hypothetical protein